MMMSDVKLSAQTKRTIFRAIEDSAPQIAAATSDSARDAYIRAAVDRIVAEIEAQLNAPPF